MLTKLKFTWEDGVYIYNLILKQVNEKIWDCVWRDDDPNNLIPHIVMWRIVDQIREDSN